jgi:mono/diheme cytochrome c family protein
MAHLIKQRTYMKATVLGIVSLFFVATSFVTNQPGGLKASMERGKKVYETYCLACHQPDGTGVPNLNPPLVKTKWVLGDKKQLAKIILKGLKGGEIEIEGDQFHNPMPPQESVLSDKEIADVLTYVRNSFGNKASLVTAAEVKAVRATSK